MRCFRRSEGRHVGARACLKSDTSPRGVIDSQAERGWLVARFADKILNVRVAYLNLQSDAASFEPSQAPRSFKERRQEERSSANESLKRGLSIAASKNRVHIYVQSL